MLTENGDLVGYNVFAYCRNNPIVFIDPSGYAFETIWDAISFACSVAEVISKPYDPWSWIALVGDAADLVVPFIGGIGETTRALKAASISSEVVDNVLDVKKGWKIGDDITNLTKAGNPPKWSTLRSRYWKNKAHYFSSDYSKENLNRMIKGLAPQYDEGFGIYSMELHHILGRKGENFYLFFEVTPVEHAIIDPFRNLK